MFKFIQSIMPWYIRPSLLSEIVPEIMKDRAKQKPTEQTSSADFKFGLEEVVYGLGVLLVLFWIRSSL